MILRQKEMASPKSHYSRRAKKSSPFNGNCTQSNVVYGCKITSNETAEDSPHYIGLTESICKDRLYKRKKFNLNRKLKE